MTKTNDLREQVALFRYGIIADFVNLPPGTQGLYSTDQEKKLRKAISSPDPDEPRWQKKPSGHG